MAASLSELKRKYYGAALGILEPILSTKSLSELEQAFFTANMSLTLPTVGDAGKVVTVNGTGDGYILTVPSAGGGSTFDSFLLMGV